jgi:hypothetical protein
MPEHRDTPDTDLDDRLRTAVHAAAPDAPTAGVVPGVERRVARRRRRVREAVGAAVVVLVGGGTAVGFALSSGPPLAADRPPGHVVTSTSTTGATATSGSPDVVGAPSDAGTAGLHAQSTPAPDAPPCPVGQSVPSDAIGRYCGPTPGPGSGSGPDGTCTGSETVPPCGPGAEPDRYYAYTMPGTCNGLITFDGRQWVAELTPPTTSPDSYVWMRLTPSGLLGWIGPTGAVGFQAYTGQALSSCRQ